MQLELFEFPKMARILPNENPFHQDGSIVFVEFQKIQNSDRWYRYEIEGEWRIIPKDWLVFL